MKVHQLLYITSFIILSCNLSSNEKNCEQYFDPTVQVDSLNVPIDPHEAYFPIGIFTDSSKYIGYDTSRVRAYSSYLKHFKEPLIYNKQQDKSVYRFFWLPSFHYPIVIRIEQQGDSYSLTWNAFVGKEELWCNKTVASSEETWNEFQELLAQVAYWDLRTNDEEIHGTDGARWILEGTDMERYHLVDRWSPRKGNYFKCCKFLVEQTDLEINLDEMY